MKIIEILRLAEVGYPQTKIRDSVKRARSTVSEVLKRCREAGITYGDACEMPPDRLQALLYPKVTPGYRKEEPDYEAIDNHELQRYPNLNLRYLVTEYKQSNPAGFQYSQFCERYNRWNVS